MSLNTPTIKEISDNIIAQLEAELNQTIPLLQKAFLRILAKVLAAVWVIQYKRSGFSSLQLFVASASANQTTFNGVSLIPLNEWGKLIGVGEPTAATQAEHTINITVENQVGSIPSGSPLIGVENGVTYITLGSTLLDAAFVTADVRAVADQNGGNGSGTIGNLEVGAAMSFVNPLANVSRDAFVQKSLVTGANAEATEDYRASIVSRFQQQPQGGAPADYRIWALETLGIVNAYIYTGLPGQVNVYTESTTDIDPDGIPPQATLNEVLDNINYDQAGLASRRPANAFVNSLPIVRSAFDVDVNGLDVDDEADVQAAITTALTEYFLGREPFIEGLSVLPSKDIIFSAQVSGIVADVVTAVGGIFVGATVELAGNPVVSYALNEGEKAKLGGIVFS